MQVGIAFRAVGDDLPDMLDESAIRAEHQGPVLNQIAGKMMRRERRFFETRGAATGRYWSPLRGSTVKRKTKHKLDPLINEGDLMRSVSDRGAKYQYLRITDLELTLGTSHPAAVFHDRGTRHMPARPFLVVPEKHRQEYLGDIQTFIFQGELP